MPRVLCGSHKRACVASLQARNENLSNTLVELSAQVGQLQAREQALTTMIKLKVTWGGAASIRRGA